MNLKTVIAAAAACAFALGGCKKEKAQTQPPAATKTANTTGDKTPASKPSATSKPTAGGVPKTCDRAKYAKLALEAGTKVMGGVSMKDSTKQADLLASMDLYSGKKVRIEGPIVGICQGAGCWAAIRGPSGKHLNLKVKDGEVDFRALSKIGYYAVGEGVFTPTGHHGAQIKISGAMISKTRCQ
jgi:hypothetical protein